MNVFIARQTNDEALKEKPARNYSTGICSSEKDGMVCNGYHTTEEANEKICGPCEIQVCGREKAVLNCAGYRDYPCKLIEKYIPRGSENRNLLNNLA